MISSGTVGKNTIPCATIKIHESLIIWLVSLIVWHTVFSTCGINIDNAEYLQWGATALTVVWVTKWLVWRDGCLFSNFLGSINISWLTEIYFVTGLSILLGIGSWAVLVFFEACFNRDWTYQWWGLIAPANFEQIHWVKSWLFINAISATILVPITEEIIFRGLILRRLIDKHGRWTAIWISSLIFSFFHINKSFFGSFFHAILFSILAIKFASLYAPILAHGTYNFFALFAQTHVGIFLVADKEKIQLIENWMPELVCLVLGISILSVYVIKNRHCLSENPI